MTELLESLTPGAILIGIAALTTYFTRPKRAGLARISAVEWLVLAVFTLIISTILYPILLAARPAYYGPTCLSNVKQLNIGVLMYCQDFDERFPPADRWSDCIWPYTKNNNLFKCPEATTPYGYAFNKALNCLQTINVKDEKSTVVLFEANVNSLNAFGSKAMLVPEPRHEGKDIYGYADGHGKKLVRTESMRWEP